MNGEGALAILLGFFAALGALVFVLMGLSLVFAFLERSYRFKASELPSRVEIGRMVSRQTFYATVTNDRVREAMIRYGTNGSSLEEVARAMFCTRERVRQLILKGARQFRTQ